MLFLTVCQISYLKPSFNGTAPGCAGSDCHTFQDGIIKANIIDSTHVQVMVLGVSSGKKVAGELVDSLGVVVDVNNSTTSNPFILTAPYSGRFLINVGFKSPSKRWDSTYVSFSFPETTNPDSGWQSDLVITEIMFDVPRDMEGDANGDGVRGSHSDEFVELYNRGDSTISLSGYQILDREKITVFTFPEGAEITPGQFAVVFGAVGTEGFGNNIPSGTALFAVHQNTNDNLGFDNGQGKSNFSNSGDCVIIVNPNAADTLAEIYWGSANPATSHPVYLGYPNTISGTQISGAIRQSVTHYVDSLLWDEHTVVSGNSTSLYSPGFDVNLPVSINRKVSAPQQYHLKQNYPNPFNPSTLIQYELPKRTFVELSIYDILGKKVKTIVRGMQESGIHSASFNGKDFAGGLYFYCLKTPEFREIRKMILIK